MMSYPTTKILRERAQYRSATIKSTITLPIRLQTKAIACDKQRKHQISVEGISMLTQLETNKPQSIVQCRHVH